MEPTEDTTEGTPPKEVPFNARKVPPVQRKIKGEGK